MVNSLYDRRFPEHNYPALVCIGVAKLPFYALLEIDSDGGGDVISSINLR